MSANVRARYLFCSSALILFFGIPTTAQTRTCDLQLEVIQNPEPGHAKEIPIPDVVATYFDKVTKKTVRARLKDGFPLVTGLAEGRYLFTVTKKGYKTTLKAVDLVCELANGTGAVSEIVFLWKGKSDETVPLFGYDRSGGISYGIVVDNSTRIHVSVGVDSADPLIQGFKSKMHEITVAVTRDIVQENHGDDETFLARFVGPDRNSVVQDFTSNRDLIYAKANGLFIESGEPAIFDSVLFAAKHLAARESTKQKALILITYHAENTSKTTLEDLLRFLNENQIRLFIVGLPNAPITRQTLTIYRNGAPMDSITMPRSVDLTSNLDKLATRSGGKRYVIGQNTKISTKIKELWSDMRER